jgi:hypothetical protein
MPEAENLFDHIIVNAKRVRSPDQVVRVNAALGKTLAICGAGPSLATELEHLQRMPAHQVWACNSALPYLMDLGLPVTHGFCIDQGREMLNPEEWQRTFDVRYLIASSVHPELVEHLCKANRRIKWFHNYLGRTDPEGWEAPANWVKPAPNCGYEMWLYQTKWPGTVQVGYGLNAVPRAICLALWMGFKTIRVYGADCAAAPDAPVMPSMADPAYVDWLSQVVLYADGRTARSFGATAIMVEHEVGPHRWHTRADMVISAKHLVDLTKTFDGTLGQDGRPKQVVELIGDTLPNAIKDQPEDYFATMPQLTGAGGIAGFVLRA